MSGNTKREEEALRRPSREQGVLRRVDEDRHGDLPAMPDQGANVEAFSR